MKNRKCMYLLYNLRMLFRLSSNLLQKHYKMGRYSDANQALVDKRHVEKNLRDVLGFPTISWSQSWLPLEMYWLYGKRFNVKEFTRGAATTFAVVAECIRKGNVKDTKTMKGVVTENGISDILNHVAKALDNPYSSSAYNISSNDVIEVQFVRFRKYTVQSKYVCHIDVQITYIQGLDEKLEKSIDIKMPDPSDLTVRALWNIRQDVLERFRNDQRKANCAFVRAYTCKNLKIPITEWIVHGIKYRQTRKF